MNIVKIGTTFYLCSILGYLYELGLEYYYNHDLLSHSFLCGPWLPIYGLGSLLISLFSKYQKFPLVIFSLSFIVSAFLEGLSGLLLLKIFKIRLWDYTNRFLNIGGFVCFLSAFIFGLGGLLITYIINPLIKKLTLKFNNELKYILSFLSLIFTLDLIASLNK